MRAISLMYHDVIPDSTEAAALLRITPYSLTDAQFRSHLRSIRAQAPVQVIEGFRLWDSPKPIFLTFDDGDVSGITHAAAALEEHGWRGHFFVTTDWIGKPHFMNRSQILEMRRRGHVIGSHSCSHPERMSHLTSGELIKEWTDSCAVLGEILSEDVFVASVPAGYYSREVGRAAAAAGIKVLFTSEPTTATHIEQGCLILGRYCIQSQMACDVSGKIADARLAPRWGQTVAWETKKVLKTMLGESYFKIRSWLLARLGRQTAPAQDPASDLSQSRRRDLP
jgi:peptidoglycan/xylan/chitin deacetylase (PgdA/CDA1 family)